MADESNNITDTPYSPSRFTDQSTAPLGVLSAEQGRSTIDEVADADIQAHGKLMNDLLLQTYNSSQAHLIDVKKRLIEEKEIAMMEAERSYLNKYDQLQNEIRELRESIQEQEAEINRQRETFSILSESAATLAAKRSAKYSSPSSLSRMFRAWAEEVHSTRRSDKLDTVAKAFARKYLLAKTFLGMCLNSQKRKSGKANAESRFKFESVTTEVRLSSSSAFQCFC